MPHQTPSILEILRVLKTLPHGVVKQAIEKSVHVTGDYKLIISERRFIENISWEVSKQYKHILRENEREQEL